MNRCLREEALWFVFEGGGERKEREHVERCERCSTRLRQLQSEVQTLSQVLREVPPAPVKVFTPHRFFWPWVPLMAAGVAALMFVWNGLLLQNPRKPQATTLSAAQQEEIVKILENEVYDALFTNDGLVAIEFSSRVSTLAYVQAALDGGWPCEPRRAVCDQSPFFLRIKNR